MRGVITRRCPPRESVLQAAEIEMTRALADANAARDEGDVSAYARHLARLHALVEQAAELVRRSA